MPNPWNSSDLPFQNILDHYNKLGNDDPLLSLGLMQKDRKDPEMINKWGMEPLSQAEHYASSKYEIGQNPWMFPGRMISIPGYYAAKKTGLWPKDEFQSPPSLDQMGAGIRGAWAGFNQ